ncbi:MAG: pallilysin-related adhesin [Treponema sp.]|nr:pallilysin-related adhesin [Treponema sp.]
MKHKFVLIIFVAFAIALISFFVMNGNPSKQTVSTPQSKIVKPVVTDLQNENFGDDGSNSESTTLTSFIPLAPDETLLNIITVDFDGDMRDDQINLVRKVTSPYLWLLVGLYDTDTGSYERTFEIQTAITQVHSFSYAGLDVLGNHQMELVYQGVTDAGDSVLRIYQLKKKRRNGYELNIIGDFVSDGSLFIQQSSRDQAYELSQVNAEPYSIVAYGSLPDSAVNSGNSYEQYQITYNWDKKSNSFVETERVKMSDRRVAANELAKIQDGTIGTFTDFLDGLWYKTSNDGDGIRYLSFDYADSEIILQYNDFEEVYVWLESYLSNSGIYLSAKNTTISSLNRRYYITLVATDEIRLRIQENIGMIIDESNLWNGNYKKMTPKTAISSSKKKITSEDFLKDLTAGEIWYASDGTKFTFSSGKYVASGDLSEETGKFTVMDVGSVPVVSFRSDANVERPFLKQNYQLSYGMITPPAPKNRSKAKKPVPVIDHNTIIIQAVHLSLQMPEPVDSNTITLTRGTVTVAQ